MDSQPAKILQFVVTCLPSFIKVETDTLNQVYLIPDRKLAVIQTLDNYRQDLLVLTLQRGNADQTQSI